MAPSNEEITMAKRVQSARRALLELMTPEEQATERRKGSTVSTTFEDAARDIADHAADPRSALVGSRLAELQAAINAFWTWAVDAGIPRRIAKRHRGACMSADEAEAEAVYQLRSFVLTYEPDGAAALEHYAWARLRGLLNEAEAQCGPVELPRAAARRVRVADYRDDQTHLDSEVHDPWEVVDCCIDNDNHTREEG